MGIPMGYLKIADAMAKSRALAENASQNAASLKRLGRFETKTVPTSDPLAAPPCRTNRVDPMSRLVWIAIVSLTLWPRLAKADEWWGRDKALHFTVSIGISAAAYAAAVPLTERREYRAGVGAATALTLGAMKEGYDALGYGDPSWRDFAWDAAGTAVGVMIAYAVDCIVSNTPNRSARTATARSPITISF
jgi:putative lipoprotein